MEQYFKEMDKKEGVENKLDSIREMKRKVVSCKEVRGWSTTFQFQNILFDSLIINIF